MLECGLVISNNPMLYSSRIWTKGFCSCPSYFIHDPWRRNYQRYWLHESRMQPRPKNLDSGFTLMTTGQFYPRPCDVHLVKLLIYSWFIDDCDEFIYTNRDTAVKIQRGGMFRGLHAHQFKQCCCWWIFQFPLPDVCFWGSPYRAALSF